MNPKTRPKCESNGNANQIRVRSVRERSKTVILMTQHFVYCITSKKRKYIGATNHPLRRLRAHNCELSGGAKKTKDSKWKFEILISGFRSWRETLQFEWAFKHAVRKSSNTSSRLKELQFLLSKERWTSNSPLSCDVPLTYRVNPADVE